jgi:hypothetical protein
MLLLAQLPGDCLEVYSPAPGLSGFRSELALGRGPRARLTATAVDWTSQVMMMMMSLDL